MAAFKFTYLFTFQTWIDVSDILSTRVKNHLCRCLGSQVLDQPEIIATVGITQLRLIIGIGPKSLKEIALALNNFGYVQNIDEWLED